MFQTLLGVTGSGKTYTMANVIARTGRSAIVMAHNKTLAAQLYAEFRDFFPDNAIEYFVSYYDYYQPEAYVPHKDLFIEKDSSINEHIEQMRFNTAVSTLMECANALAKFDALTPVVARQFILLLAPLAPHMAEEVWAELGEKESIHVAGWPAFDAELVKDDVVEVAIQVNGKLRGTMPASVDAAKEELEAAAQEVESVKKHLEGKEIVKIIVVPNKMVSIVAR